MSDSDSDKLGEIRDLLKKQVSMLGGGGGRGSYGGDAAPTRGAGGGSGFGGAAESANKLTGGLDALWRGTINVSTGFDTLTTALGNSTGTLGKAFTDMSNKIGHTILDTNDQLNISAKYGANHNNNLSEYDKLIKGARMTHEEYNDMLKKGAEEMRGLGSNINLAQKNLLLMSKEVQEGKVGSSLREIGLGANDLNEVLQGAMTNRRGMDMSDPAAKKAAIESAERMTVAMEETARITGESRKDQVEELKKKSEDARVQMKLSMMDKQAKERYEAGMQQMHQLGPAAEKLYRDQFLGKITKDGSNAIAALGTSAADISRYALAQKDGSEEGMARAKELGKTAVASNVEWQNSTGAKNFGIYGEGAAADMVGESWTKNKVREPINAKIDEVKNQTGQTIDAATAMEQMKDVVHNSMQQKNADGTPNTDPGTATAITINKGNRAISDLTAGASIGFGKLNDKLGESIQQLGGFNEALKPRTQEEASPLVKLQEAADFVSPKGLRDAFNESRADQTHEKTTPDAMGADVKRVHRKDGSPSFDNFLNGGSFSSMFEQFDPAGTPAELHGEEAVVTRKQMESLFTKITPLLSSVAQPTQKTAELPAIPPVDLKNESKTPDQKSSVTDATTVATETASKVLSQSLNVASERIKDLTAALHDFKPLDHVNKVVEKVTAAQKPITSPAPAPAPATTPVVAPAVSSNPELRKIADQINSDKAKEEKKEQKPAEIKKEEPKLLNLGIKTAEDLNKFIFGGATPPKDQSALDKEKAKEEGQTAKSQFQADPGNIAKQLQSKFAEIMPNPFDKINVPKIDESQIAAALSQKQPMDKHIDELSKSVSSSIANKSPIKHEEPKKSTTVEQKPKAPDVSSLDASLLNLAKFNKALTSGDISKIGMSQMDLSDSGKSAESKLGPTTARVELQKKREALENASFDFEQMKAANTKPSAEAAERLAKKKEEVSKLAVSYEEDLIKTKGKLKLHANEEVKHAEIKNKHNEVEKSQQVAKALADEKKFMKEHGPEANDKAKAQLKTDADKTVDNFNATNFKLYDEDEASVRKRQEEQAESKDKSPGIFDSISNLFTSSSKPAFASGNVKYEEIPQAEIDAKNKRMQESIGKVDNSSEAIAAQQAELNRQKYSGMYKQPETKINDVKKPAETKEDAHVKEMYKKYGLETFKDYNSRVSAEVKDSHAQIKNISSNKKDFTAADVAPKPIDKPKPVEQQPPAPVAQPPMHVVEKEITLKDIHETLIKLNKTMAEVAHHSEQTVKVGHKQVSETKKSSGSRW